jgi:5'-nucleotidase
MRILITNDDGIHAEGLHALRRELAPIAEVTVIAPDRPRSACSHCITLHKPLRVERVTLDDNGSGYICSGTPSDCVVLAAEELMPCPPDVIVSGINLGPNLGDDVTYSGTVAAALEGTLLGIRSFAISVAGFQTVDFTFAARFARRLARVMPELPLPAGVFLNVDVPNLPPEAIKGYAFTRQGRHR